MKTETWLVLILVLFLAGCAAGAYPGYETDPYYAPTWREPAYPGYYYDRVPPLPVSPEVLGSLPGNALITAATHVRAG